MIDLQFPYQLGSAIVLVLSLCGVVLHVDGLARAWADLSRAETAMRNGVRYVAILLSRDARRGEAVRLAGKLLFAALAAGALVNPPEPDLRGFRLFAFCVIAVFLTALDVDAWLRRRTTIALIAHERRLQGEQQDGS